MTIPPLTEADFARMIPASLRRRLMAGQIESGKDVAALRNFVQLSQSEFAEAMGISVHTLRNWEQGRRKPDGPAIGLLRIAARHPRIIRENLGAGRGASRPPTQYQTRLADADTNSLEHHVSVAVVKPDHESAVQAVIDGVNLFADALAMKNPVAGLAVRTASVLSGWVWNRMKFDRVRPVLEAVSSRIQKIDSEYVRKGEFGDLLEDVLRRISEQPDSERRRRLANAVIHIIDAPQEHVRNRWFLRCADELDSAALELLNVLDDLKEMPFSNPAMCWVQMVERTSRGKADIDETIGRLASEHLVLPEGTMGLIRAGQAPAPYRIRLTTWGAELLRYIRAAPASANPSGGQRRRVR
jgi:DNA-binding transcriptional regulator YiaG